MPNFGYHFARFEGRLVRRIYRALSPQIIRRPIAPIASVPFEVFAYSGHANLPEQVASIRSFLKHCGRPARFAVVSDGTYSPADIAMLNRLDSCVAVVDFSRSGALKSADQGNVGTPESAAQGVSAMESAAPWSRHLENYLSTHPTGRQLALIMSLPRNGPALYVDSDVLFFPQAGDLATLANARDISAFYLPDCQFSGDPRLLRLAGEREQPVNTGVILLLKKLDWSLGIQRFTQLNGAPDFFTNQTMTHLVMHANGAAPLDPTRYVLQLDDQTVYPDRYASEALALRHYVNPVRHKFWTTLWRR